jgi:hypothetical protein
MSKIFSVSDKLTVSTAWLYAIGKFNDENLLLSSPTTIHVTHFTVVS